MRRIKAHNQACLNPQFYANLPEWRIQIKRLAIADELEDGTLIQGASLLR